MLVLELVMWRRDSPPGIAEKGKLIFPWQRLPGHLAGLSYNYATARCPPRQRRELSPVPLRLTCRTAKGRDIHRPVEMLPLLGTQRSARQCTGVNTLVDNRLSVDNNVVYTFRVLLRLLKSGFGFDSLRVEDDQIRLHPSRMIRGPLGPTAGPEWRSSSAPPPLTETSPLP